MTSNTLINTNIPDGHGRSEIEENVLRAIRSGQAKMRPKWRFTLQAALTLTGIIVLFFILLTALSLAISAFEANGGLFAAGFGLAGFRAFIASLPWILLVLSLVLLVILATMLDRFTIAYHQPFFYLMLSLLIVASLASAAIAMTSISGGVIEYATTNSIPVVPALYQWETTPVDGFYRGEVVNIGAGSFMLENAIGETSTVVLPPKDISGLTGIKVGDSVIVLGSVSKTGTIVATGFEKARIH